MGLKSHILPARESSTKGPEIPAPASQQQATKPANANLPAVISQPEIKSNSDGEFTITVDELFEDRPHSASKELVPFHHHQVPIPINPETHLEELELYPRHTLIRMLQEKAYDENFTFKCRPRKGADYVQAMRQHLSRGRRVAERRHLELQEFKLLVVGIETFNFYDLVTLVRTTQASRSAKTVYDDLIGFVASEIKHGETEGE